MQHATPSGPVVLITGAASGVGAAAATMFADGGARLVLVDRDADALTAVADGCDGSALAVHADVADEGSVAAAVNAAVAEHGHLDCMFNNAGVYGFDGPIAETPADAFDDAVRILLRGVFLGTKHAARVMAPRRQGRIIATASVAGMVGGLGPHAYSAAKAGVIGFTKSVAAELRHHGITVNCVVPGGIATPMLAEVLSGDREKVGWLTGVVEDRPSLERPALPHEIAAAALWLAGPHAAHVTGHALVVDGGMATAYFRETVATRAPS